MSATSHGWHISFVTLSWFVYWAQAHRENVQRDGWRRCHLREVTSARFFCACMTSLRCPSLHLPFSCARSHSRSPSLSLCLSLSLCVSLSVCVCVRVCVCVCSVVCVLQWVCENQTSADTTSLSRCVCVCVQQQLLRFNCSVVCVLHSVGVKTIKPLQIQPRSLMLQWAVSKNILKYT